MAGDLGGVIYHKEYENGYITIYPTVLVVKYTIEHGSDRIEVFKYNWVSKVNDGFVAYGPHDVLRIYTTTDGKRISIVHRTAQHVEYRTWETRR